MLLVWNNITAIAALFHHNQFVYDDDDDDAQSDSTCYFSLITRKIRRLF